jgi:aspartate 1-decarboxylase
MRRTFLKSRIRPAPETPVDLDEGSVRGAGDIGMDGATAHLDKPRDIASSFAGLEESEARTFSPTELGVGSQNRIVARNAVEAPGPARRVRA